MKTIAPAAQPGVDMRGGTPLTADGHFTKESHTKE
jgi:hypothetical protein